MDIERIRGVLTQMKLQDKAELTGGGTATPAVTRPKVNGVKLTDGLLPYACNEPTALALGCTFSPEIVAAVSKARSLDAARGGAAVAGTIAAGLILDPTRADACDFFSEDAHVAAQLLQSYAAAGVVGYVFTDALGQGRFANRVIDARALNELYLQPLARAGKYAAALQMDGGYLNGERIATSRAVADMYLRYIPQDAPLITQYCADGADAVAVAGNGAYRLGATAATKRAVANAVADGELVEQRLNRSIERVLALAVNTHEFYKKPFDRSVDASLVAGLAADSAVLLKNEGALPVRGKNMTIFGDAEYFEDGERYALIPVKDAVKRYGAFNVFLLSDYETSGISAELAETVSKVAAVSSVVLVLCGGCAAPLGFADEAKAVMFCPSQTSVAAVVDLLTKTSPRGHLPFTWCRSSGAYPRNNPKYVARGDFRYESVYNGYLLFNNFKSDVAYPFGHGLDYTRYEISKYNVKADGTKIIADFVIKNVGEREGTALCQAYITLIGGAVYGQSKRLAAFKRVTLEKTENAHIVLEIDLEDFAVYDEKNTAFATVGGRYQVDLGLSSVDIRASGTVKVAAGSKTEAGLNERIAPSYYKLGSAFAPTAPEIEKLLKVPFIKKPDEYPELDPPPVAKIKKLVKKAEKTTPRHLLPAVKYKIFNTPDKNCPE